MKPADEDLLEADPEPCVVARPGDEPIAGYRLLELLGSGGFGEVWKCEVPGGLLKALKIVRNDGELFGDNLTRAALELQAVERIKAIRHPFLLSIDRIEFREKELLIVTELADRSLNDLLEQRQAEGLPGIPREELLPLVLEAAEALDVINFEHGLQHLDVKPRNLLLVGKHVKVADFGLVYSLKELGGTQPLPRPCAVTPQYASPEALQSGLSPHSDQYSLAIVYQELLTGTFPFQGKTASHHMILHLAATPNLNPLPEADRPAVARALSRSAEQRFPSCLEFVQALIAAEAPAAETRRPAKPPSTRRLRPPALRQTPVAPPAPSTTVPPTPDPQPTVALSGSRPTSLADYRVLEILSRGPLGDVRRIEAPGCRPRLARFLPRLDAGDPQAEERLVTCLEGLRHPALPEIEVRAGEAGEVVLVTDVLAPTLRDRFQECTAEGQPGIPHAELLGYLRTAGAALDALHEEHGLHHLGLNPRTLLVRDGRLWLADFGLVQLLWLPLGYSAAPLNGRFSDPGLDRHGNYQAADQYSLALIYAEMRTGVAPRAARSRSGAGRGMGKIDLSFLSARDRDVLARALHDDPGKRFATCAELVEALDPTPVAPAGRAPAPPPRLGAVVPVAELLGQPASGEILVPPLGVLLPEVLAGWEAALPVGVAGGVNCLERSCLLTTLPAQMVRLKLQVFRQQWGAVRVRRDEEGYSFRVRGARNLWQRCLGQETALTVSVHLEPLSGEQARMSRATVRVEPSGQRAQDREQLQQLGPRLIGSILAALEAQPDHRVNRRLPFAEPLRAYPVLPGPQLGEPLDGRGRDISGTGIGLVLPRAPEADRLYLHLHTTAPLAPFVVLTRVVWARPRTDGWCEVGASFVTEDQPGPPPEPAAVP